MPDAYVEGLFQTQDGPRIEYRVYPAVGEERGDPVLCLHGLTRNLRDFEELAPRIAALGRRVITTSQRGRGGSDPDPVPERYTPAVYAADMLALLDHLGVQRAIYVGTSMGGLMTMITAAIAPGRMSAAVLNDVGPEIDPVGLKRIQSYVGGVSVTGNWREAAEYCRAINGAAFPNEQDEAFWISFARKMFREVAPGQIVLDYDAAISRNVAPPPGDQPPVVDLWPLYDALKPVPTLLIRGALTDILASSVVERMRQRKPDLEVVETPGVGHAPFMTEPAAFAALGAFIEAH
ncbi:MAG: alpha/beta hydrolase [Hyphomonadaceae bacterium]